MFIVIPFLKDEYISKCIHLPNTFPWVCVNNFKLNFWREKILMNVHFELHVII